jgi:hypothetical protein
VLATRGRFTFGGVRLPADLPAAVLQNASVGQSTKSWAGAIADRSSKSARSPRRRTVRASQPRNTSAVSSPGSSGAAAAGPGMACTTPSVLTRKPARALGRAIGTITSWVSWATRRWDDQFELSALASAGIDNGRPIRPGESRTAGCHGSSTRRSEGGRVARSRPCRGSAAAASRTRPRCRSSVATPSSSTFT